MNIVFVHSGKSFLPELGAYVKHLKAMGHGAHVVNDILNVNDIKNEVDAVFRFAGLLTKSSGISLPEIHNYNSASTGSFPKVRNIIKSFLSAQPIGRIYLNSQVKSEFFFYDEKPFIYRDMGADMSFFNSRKNKVKKYDLVYAGSISGRPGVVRCLRELNEKGIKIGLAGNASNLDYKEIKSMRMVEFLGVLKPNEVASFISLGKFGLNFCPDIYPFNMQTSTKVIEYLVAGLGVVSNKYKWMDEHSTTHGYQYINVKNVATADDLTFNECLTLEENEAMKFEWESLLLNCGFCNFLVQLISK